MKKTKLDGTLREFVDSIPVGVSSIVDAEFVVKATLSFAIRAFRGEIASFDKKANDQSKDAAYREHFRCYFHAYDMVVNRLDGFRRSVKP